MKRREALVLLGVAGLVPVWGQAGSGGGVLAAELSKVYEQWRQGMIRKDVAIWQMTTAPHRQVEVKNLLASERRAFPAALFQIPVPPPGLEGLKLIHVSQKGVTAKAAWFGKVDFGVGGDPTENLMVLSFVNVGGRWKYDRAQFVNLSGLPEVRRELAEGNLRYVKETPDFEASGVVPQTPVAVGPAKYIAKVYVFCPGREVSVLVNGISRHRFLNAKEAEVVIGGARDGVNRVNFSIKAMDGGTGKEALAVRVYLMSQIPGTQPIKAFEYLVEEGGAVKPSGDGTFTVDVATAARLVPKR